VEILMSCLASPPLSGIVYRLGSPSRELMKSNRFPSGENCGELSPLAPYVNWRTLRPSTSIIQMWLIRLARERSDVPST